MSDEILGHDVNGEALRAGDRITCLVTNTYGHVTQVEPDPRHWLPHNRNCLEYKRDDGVLRCAEDRKMRRLQSGRDVFNQARDSALNQGNPDTQRTEPTTTERAQAWISGQPWVEPSR